VIESRGYLNVEVRQYPTEDNMTWITLLELGKSRGKMNGKIRQHLIQHNMMWITWLNLGTALAVLNKIAFYKVE